MKDDNLLLIVLVFFIGLMLKCTINKPQMSQGNTPPGGWNDTWEEKQRGGGGGLHPVDSNRWRKSGIGQNCSEMSDCMVGLDCSAGWGVAGLCFDRKIGGPKRSGEYCNEHRECLSARCWGKSPNKICS